MPTPYRRPTLLTLLAAATMSACGSWQRVGETPGPTTEREVTQMFDANGLYARLGRLVSSQDVPYIGSVACVPGPHDSTMAIVANALANRVFAFERSGSGFGAHYRIEYEFDRAGAPPIIVGQNKPVIVGSFQETMRTDESIIEQQKVALAPGDYQIVVRVRDLNNSQVGTASTRTTVPAFVPGTYTAPILAYQVRSRTTRDDSLAVVLNPRGTVAFGGDTLLIYLEGYGYTKPADLPVQVRDEHDSVVMHSTVHFTGTGKVESRVLRVVPDFRPLGQLEILVGPDNAVHDNSSPNRFAIAAGGDAIHRTNALVSFSSAWVVTNFDDLLSLLRYFGENRRVEAMRRAKTTDRIELWQEFYKSTDPNPATPENEALDQYFARIAIANQRYRETGFAGWRSDRGEAFIILGEPDVVQDQSAQLQNAGRIIRWEYSGYRLVLYFQDITGFGRFQLTPQSRSDFEHQRIRVQQDHHGAG